MSIDDDMGEDDQAACGIRHVNGVSLNQKAEFGEFPWMVAIMLKPEKTYFGGGSILSPKIVLTAAHKVDSIDAEKLLIRAGEWDMNSELERYPHIDRNVSEILLHDSYSKTTKTNNIALLVLDNSFSNNPHISPICLPSANAKFDYSNCIVTGWGQKTLGARYEHVLKEVTVPIVPRDECLEKLLAVRIPPSHVHPSYMCAGGKAGFDSCLGDGGAPLVCPILGNPDRYYQTGIVAWGVRCAMDNVPAVYTNVSYLLSWVIKELDRLGIDKQFYTL